MEKLENVNLEQKRNLTRASGERDSYEKRLKELEATHEQMKTLHIDELERKNCEIRDLSNLNEEALKTANEAQFSEKKYKKAIAKLKEELEAITKEFEHKQRCHQKMIKENEVLKDEIKNVSRMLNGTKVENMKKMQLTVDEKDRQIQLLKEMVHGVKGEVKVREVDIKKLKTRAGILEETMKT